MYQINIYDMHIDKGQKLTIQFTSNESVSVNAGCCLFNSEDKVICSGYFTNQYTAILDAENLTDGIYKVYLSASVWDSDAWANRPVSPRSNSFNLTVGSGIPEVPPSPEPSPPDGNQPDIDPDIGDENISNKEDTPVSQQYSTSHEAKPNNPNPASGAYNWNDAPRINPDGAFPQSSWNAIGHWMTSYLVKGASYYDNVAVLLQNPKMWIWNTATKSWDVLSDDFEWGTWYLEDFWNDGNGNIANTTLWQTGESANHSKWVKIKQTSETTGRCFHPWGYQKNWRNNPNWSNNGQPYIITKVDFKLVKWDNNGVDNLDRARIVVDSGADWWRNVGDNWQPDWSTSRDMAVGKYILAAKELKRAYCTNLPRDWSYGFPESPPPTTPDPPINQAPFVGPVFVSNETVNGGFTLTYTANDPDGDVLTHKLKLDNGAYSPINPIKNGNEYKFNGSGLSAGTHSGQIQVFDGKLSSESTVFTITIRTQSTGLKAKLRDAKNIYEDRHNALKTTINTIISDNAFDKETESDLLNQAFTNYNKALSDFKKIAQKAIDFISDVRKTEAIEESKIHSNAQLKIVNDSITLRVEKVEEGKVDSDKIISSINQTAERIKISASKIDLQGYITASDLSGTSSTTIDGSNISTGVIKSRDGSFWFDLNNGRMAIYDNNRLLGITHKMRDNSSGKYGLGFQANSDSFIALALGDNDDNTIYKPYIALTKKAFGEYKAGINLLSRVEMNYNVLSNGALSFNGFRRNSGDYVILYSSNNDSSYSKLIMELGDDNKTSFEINHKFHNKSAVDRVASFRAAGGSDSDAWGTVGINFYQHLSMNNYKIWGAAEIQSKSFITVKATIQELSLQPRFSRFNLDDIKYAATTCLQENVEFFATEKLVDGHCRVELPTGFIHAGYIVTISPHTSGSYQITKYDDYFEVEGDIGEFDYIIKGIM